MLLEQHNNKNENKIKIIDLNFYSFVVSKLETNGRKFKVMAITK